MRAGWHGSVPPVSVRSVTPPHWQGSSWEETRPGAWALASACPLPGVPSHPSAGTGGVSQQGLVGGRASVNKAFASPWGCKTTKKCAPGRAETTKDQ